MKHRLRPGSHQGPDWLHEGTRLFDPGRGKEAIVQSIGEYEDAATRPSMPCAVFLRPRGRHNRMGASPPTYPSPHNPADPHTCGTR